MNYRNGSVIGTSNTPTSSVASGVWDLNSVRDFMDDGIWPLPLGDAALLDLSGESYIGDMTSQAGIAGAFNGSSGAQAISNCAYKVNSTFAYAGVDMGASATIRISSATFQSSTTSGFCGSGISQLEWHCYGSNSSPSDETDGTLLGSSGTITDSSSQTGMLTVSNESFWRYLWFTSEIITGSSDDWILAEAECTGWTA